MNLGRQLEGILEYSKGFSEETVGKALKETIEYYKDEYVAKSIERAKKELENAQINKKDAVDISSYRFYVKVYEARHDLLQKITRGETTFSKTLAEINIYYDQREFNNVLLHAFSELLGGRHTKQQECEQLDSIISRIYLDNAK